jgi:F-type H+-transporting ATPase subunit epsilon
MATFSFNILSSTDSLFKSTIKQVSLPGADGEMTLLKDHMPIIAALTAGRVTVWFDEANKLPETFDISGGFVNMNADECTVFVQD